MPNSNRTSISMSCHPLSQVNPLSEKVKSMILNVQDKTVEIWKWPDEKYGDPSKLANK